MRSLYSHAMIRLAYQYFIFSLFIGAFSPYLSLYLQSKGFDPWQIGVITSLFMFPRVIAPFLWGWLADKYKRTVFTIAFIYISSLVCSIALLYQLDFMAMCLVMFSISIFWSGVMPLLDALTMSHLRHNKAQYGRVRLWGSLAYLVVVTAIGYLLDIFSASTLVYLWIAIKLIGLFSFNYLQEPLHNSSTQNIDFSIHIDAVSVLKKFDVQLFLAAIFLLAAAHTAYGSYYALYLADYGYQTHDIGLLLALAVIAEIILFAYMPRIMKFYSIKHILIFSFVCAIARYLMIDLGLTSPAALICAQLLHAATFGAYHACAVNLMSRLFSSRDNAKAQAIYTSVTFGVGGVFGSLLAGRIWQVYDGAAVFLGLSILSACGLVLLLVSFRGKYMSQAVSTTAA